jgi:hypothetical protein
VLEDVETDTRSMERKPDKVVTVLIDNGSEELVWHRIAHVDLKGLEGRPAEK